jgi:transposase
VAENGCKWRALAKRFGNWHTIYMRMKRWAKSGVLDCEFEALQEAQLIRIKIEAVSLEPHHQGARGRHGSAQKNGPQASGKSRGGWTSKIHLVAADARCAIGFSLSPGQAGDAPEGRARLSSRLKLPSGCPLIMDRAYEGNETRQLALDLGFILVVPPNPNRCKPWRYNKALYTRRNEVERLFRRLKGFHRIFTRFDKLDLMFIAFIYFALSVETLQ